MASTPLNVLKTKHLRTLEILQNLQKENQKLRKLNAEYEASSRSKYSQEQVDSILDERTHELEQEAWQREDDLLAQIKKLEEDKQRQAKAHEEALEQLTSQASLHAEERRKLEMDGLQRRKSMSGLEENLASLRNAKKELEDKVFKLEKELDGQRHLAVESEKKRSELQEMIERLQGNTDQMNKYLVRLQEQEDLMKKMAKQLEVKEKELKSLSAVNKEMKVLRGELSDERAKVASLQNTLKKFKDNYEMDSSAAKRLQENNARLQRESEQAMREIKKLKQQKAELQDALQATEMRAEEENLQHLQQKEDLENQLVDMARRFKELSDSLVNGKSRFAEFVDLKAENKNLSKKVQQLEKKGSRRRRSTEKMERHDSLDRLDTKLNQLKAQQRPSASRPPFPHQGSRNQPRHPSNSGSPTPKRSGLLV